MTQKVQDKPLRDVAYDIAIVGGGMVGLSLLQLISHYLPGTRACLIESCDMQALTESVPSFDSRSTALARGTIDIFQALGLWSNLEQRATPISRVHVSDKGHLATETDVGRKKILGCVVENAWLGRQLMHGLDAKPNIDIIAPASVSKVTPLQGRARISVQRTLVDEQRVDEQEKEFTNESAAHEQVLEAELLVIADGAQSRLRQQLGIGVEEHDYRQTAVVANVEYSKSHQGVAYERFTENGPLALLPLGESVNACTSALVWTHPHSQLDEIQQSSDQEFLQRLQQVFGYRLGKFTRVSQRAYYPLHLVQAKEQVRSNIVVMGNAAHFLHPVAGQGFNLALRDCAQLVKTLQQTLRDQQPMGSLKVLNHYLKMQEKDQWLTTQLSHSFNRIFSNKNFHWQMLRNLGFLGLDACPPIKNHFFSQMMGTAHKQIQFE